MRRIAIFTVGFLMFSIPANATIQGLTPSENAAEIGESLTLNRCFEDMPCWDCATMGNKVCGTLPRTN